MAGADPAAAAARWAQGLSGATQKITDGVNRVQVAPGAAAARQADVWVQNVTASRDKWRTNVAAVTREEWQQSMIQKGIPRIGSGATAAQSRMQAVMQQLIPQVDRIVASLPPRGNLDQNIARATAYMRAASQIKITK